MNYVTPPHSHTQHSDKRKRQQPLCTTPQCMSPRLARGKCCACYARERKQPGWKKLQYEPLVKLSVQFTRSMLATIAQHAWAQGISSQEFIRQAVAKEAGTAIKPSRRLPIGIAA